MWKCEHCNEYFGDTWGAIEHNAANEDSDIWPNYR